MCTARRGEQTLQTAHEEARSRRASGPGQALPRLEDLLLPMPFADHDRAANTGAAQLLHRRQTAPTADGRDRFDAVFDEVMGDGRSGWVVWPDPQA